jgi:predicted transposase/invertase (TIGR01784 family)
VVYFEKHGSQDDLDQTMDKIKELLSDEVFEDIRQYIKWVSHISGLNMSDSALIKLHSFAEGKEMVETLADDIREDGLQKGIQKGMQIGMQKWKELGKKDNQLSIAASMINKGFDLNIISEITGLDKKQIEAIKP